MVIMKRSGSILLVVVIISMSLSYIAFTLLRTTIHAVTIAGLRCDEEKLFFITQGLLSYGLIASRTIEHENIAEKTLYIDPSADLFSGQEVHGTVQILTTSHSTIVKAFLWQTRTNQLQHEAEKEYVKI